MGQWLAGFTSYALNKNLPGQERLIFLANINKKLPLKDYYEQYSDKRPDNHPSGDNIYKLENGKFIQLENRAHDAGNIESDLKGKNALIADEFYYFGIEAMAVPPELRPNIPQRQSPYGYLTEGQKADDFITYVKEYAAKHYPNKCGMLADPYDPIKPITKNGTSKCGKSAYKKTDNCKC